MLGHQEFFTEHVSKSIPVMRSELASRPRGRRRRRRHVPHAERPMEVVDRRNARERRRVNDVNAAFLDLQVHLPTCAPPSDSSCSEGGNPVVIKRLSKIRILQDAIDYIAQLTSLLNLSAYATADKSSASIVSTGGCMEFLPTDFEQQVVKNSQASGTNVECFSRLTGSKTTSTGTALFSEHSPNSLKNEQYWYHQEQASYWPYQSPLETSRIMPYGDWSNTSLHHGTRCIVIQPNI